MLTSCLLFLSLLFHFFSLEIPKVVSKYLYYLLCSMLVCTCHLLLKSLLMLYIQSLLHTTRKFSSKSKSKIISSFLQIKEIFCFLAWWIFFLYLLVEVYLFPQKILLPCEQKSFSPLYLVRLRSNKIPNMNSANGCMLILRCFWFWFMLLASIEAWHWSKHRWTWSGCGEAFG